MSQKRQKTSRRAKSLDELIASATFRADRHWRLVLEGDKPKGVGPDEWQDIIDQCKAHLRRQSNVAQREAQEMLILAGSLSPREEALHEALIAQAGVDDETAERLRNRAALYKRIDVGVGTIHPFDLLDDCKRSPSQDEWESGKGRIEPQEWVIA